jgi:hypothetical protein
MEHIPFEELADIAMKLKQAGANWHFHMIGPACAFNRLKNQFEIIIENESTGEESASCFDEKPVSQTRQMAELAYGPGFLNHDDSTDEALAREKKTARNDEFLMIMERARACCDAGTAWHNHHLFPQCRFNPQRGKHCIVFEEESNGDVLYAYYEDDPVKDLAELEALFFAE